MKYEVYLSSRANKQYKRFDDHIRNKIRTGLTELEEDPSKKGLLLQGFGHGLRYMKIFYAGTQYRAVYDVEETKKEVLVIFIGSRENFYKELRRFLA
jgi:mRNA-degrading endonuclease RelE of RelBE toxin-antitoxin system